MSKNYEVHGLIRRNSLYPQNLKNIEHIKDKLFLHFGDLENEHHLCSLIYEIYPDEVYHLGGQSDVRISFEIPEYTANVTGLGTLRMLEAIKNFSKNTKMYFAGSSEQFGSSSPPQNENSSMIPCSPYGAAKLFAYNICKTYRESYGMFICSGILFNHESPRRGENFVTQKIVKGLLDCKERKQDKLYLGNLNAKRDWGFSGDYCRAMFLMLQQKEPDNYVIGTGKAYSVLDFLNVTSNCIKIDWEQYVEIDSELYRPSEVNYLLADPRKAMEKLGWKPEISFEQLVKLMVDSELEKRGCK